MEKQYFETGTPEASGLSSVKLTALLEEMDKPGSPYHGVLIIRNGKKVLEAARHPFKTSMKHAQFSATKSWMSAIMGIAQGDGILDIHEKLADIFNDLDLPKLSEYSKQVTVENLLCMASGSTTDPMGYFMGNEYQDWAMGFLDFPIDGEPGKRFFYSNGGSHMCMECINHRLVARTGRNIWDYITEKLLDPLHIGPEDYSWWKTPTNVPEGAHGLYITMENMAKLGYLYLNKGLWENKQLVPKEWVEASMSVHMKETDRKPENNFGYGYQWWAHPYNGFSAQGMGGQHVHVFPDENMVVIFTAGISMRSDEDDSRLLRDYVMPALSPNALPVNESAAASLYAKADAMENPTPSRLADYAPIKALEGNWVFEKNTEGIERIGLELIDEVTLLLTLRASKRYFKVPVGLDGLCRVSDLMLRPRQVYGKTGFKGTVLADGSFLIDMATVAEPFEHKLRFTAQGDAVTLYYTNWHTADVTSEIKGTKE